MNPKRRRAAFERARRNRSFGLLGLTLVGLLIAATVSAYAADELYLAGKDNVSVYVPEMLVSGADASLVVLTTDAGGAPLPGREVTVELVTEAESRTVFSGTTDSEGALFPTFPADVPPGEANLVIRTGRTVLTKRVVVDTTTRIFLNTDKPVYQPGQVIHLRTLTFHGTAAQASTAPVTLSVQSPDGDLIYRKDLLPDAYGIASLDYPLAPILPTGTYTFLAQVGEEVVKKTVTVEPYVLPRFRIGYEGLKGWFTPEEDIVGTLRAEYFFGEVVQGTVTLEAQVYTGVWETVGEHSGNLFMGEFSFRFDPVLYAVGVLANDGNGYLELNATVTDEAGHEESKSLLLPIAPLPIRVTVLSDASIVGAESTFYAIARYPDGTPVGDASVTYRLAATGTEGQVTADERGVAEFSFTYQGESSLRVTATDGEYTGNVLLPLRGGSEGVKVVADRAEYAVGDTAQFLVTFMGEAYSNWVYYDVMARGFLVTTGRTLLEYGTGTFTLPVTADMAPRAEVRVYKTGTGMQVYRDTVILGVGDGTGLDVTVQADNATYRPGGDVSLSFQVSRDGAPAVAALGVSIVDQAVFEVDARVRGLEAVYLGLEEEFVQPEVLILDYLFGTGAPLPVDFPVEVSREPVGEAGLVSTYPLHLQRANQMREASIGGLGWSFVLVGIIGYFGLIVLSLRYAVRGASRAPYGSASGALLAVALLVAITVVIAGALYVMTTGLIGSGTTRDTGTTGEFLGGTGDVDTAQTGGTWFFDLEGLPPEVAPGTVDTATIAAPARVRVFFPETWYWNPSLITDASGTATVNLVAPDSITSWAVEAIASTKDAQIGVGSGNVTVFQDFFVEPDIPLGAVVGDQFPLRASVFNYLDQDMDVWVTLANDTWFVLQDEAWKNLTVPARSVRGVEFLITAKEWGTHKVSLLAGNALISDAVVRDIAIDPAGPWREQVVSGEVTDDETVTIGLDLNAARIPGTEVAYVKLQGGMEAVFLDGAENYIVFVSGCGEQSTSKLSVNIAAYKHLADGGAADEQLFAFETKIVQGIQHELTFLVEAEAGRAISWFGREPDLWLTAWALFAFQDLQDAGFVIDADLISDLHEYVVSTQSSDGSFSFPAVGHWSINTKLENFKEAATAYVVRALSYSGYPADGSLKKAVAYLEKHVGPEDDAFTVALTLTALSQAGGSTARQSELAASLSASAVVDADGTAHWRYASDGGGGYYYDTNAIETAGYAVLGLSLSRLDLPLASKGVQYILTHRDQGRWGSTHDTAVAFQALAAAGTLNVQDVTVDVRLNGVSVESVRFTPQTSDLTRFVNLTQDLAESNVVTLESRGTGTILYQLSLKQAMPWPVDPGPTPELFLQVTYDSTTVRVDDRITATVQLRYDGSRDELKMVLVDLRSPVGFCFEAEGLESVVEAGTVDWYEILGCREAKVYITDVPRGELVTFQYRLVAQFPIRATLQGVNAFDMYDPTVKTTLGPVEVTVTE